jgi:hypothetical protein
VNAANLHSEKEKYRNTFNVAQKANIPEGALKILLFQMTLNHRAPGSSPGAPTNPFKSLAIETGKSAPCIGLMWGNATITGASNSTTVGTSSTMTISGNNDTSVAGSGSTVAVNGATDTTTVGDQSSLTVSGAGDHSTGGNAISAWIIGNSNSSSVGNSSHIEVFGTGNYTTAGTNTIFAAAPRCVV